MLKNVDERKMTLLHFRIADVHHLQEENFPRKTPFAQLQPYESFHLLAPIPAFGIKAKPT